MRVTRYQQPDVLSKLKFAGSRTRVPTVPAGLGCHMANYDDSFGFLLKRAQHALELTTERRLQSVGLTLAQYSALAALEASDGTLSNAELARRCSVTAQTMHRVVALLERNGWVTRKAHPRHGRIQDVMLARKGKGHRRQGTQGRARRGGHCLRRSSRA